MKIGVFAPTLSGGWVMSPEAPQYRPDWFLMQEMGLKADYYGYDFLLAPNKYKGMDGKIDFWNYALDGFTTMAALAAVTKRVTLIPSISLLSVPPVYAAKQVVTVANICGPERFGVNIITGWEKPEWESQGLWPGDEYFERRYDYAAEYVSIMKHLFAHGQIDYEGEFFHMKDARLQPWFDKGEQVKIICAGQSDRGMQFTAEYADYQFMGGKLDHDELEAQVSRVRAAAALAGRPMEAFPLYQCVVRDSLQECDDVIGHWRETQDVEAVATMTGHAAMSGSEDANSLHATLMGNDNFMLWEIIKGDPKSVAEQIHAISDVEGVAGLMFTFQDFTVDLDRFGKQVMPLLR